MAIYFFTSNLSGDLFGHNELALLYKKSYCPLLSFSYDYDFIL